MVKQHNEVAKLLSAGWSRMSANVLERNGYTALVRTDHIVMYSPIGKRIERAF